MEQNGENIGKDKCRILEEINAQMEYTLDCRMEILAKDFLLISVEDLLLILVEDIFLSSMEDFSLSCPCRIGVPP